MEGYTDFLQTLPQELQEDPGDPAFLDVAQNFKEEGEPLKAVAVCLRGLSANPSFHLGRLLLARLYVELECFPFALDELERIHEDMPHVDSLSRLIERLSPGASEVSEDTYEGAEESLEEELGTQPERKSSKKEEETLAETDFDFEELDMMDDE